MPPDLITAADNTPAGHTPARSSHLRQLGVPPRRQMVFGRELRCELDGERTHDRWVGVCYLNGEDIRGVMVRRGLARDCPRFSSGRYAHRLRGLGAAGLVAFRRGRRGARLTALTSAAPSRTLPTTR